MDRMHIILTVPRWLIRLRPEISIAPCPLLPVSSSFHVFPAVFISASIVLLQVSRGRLLFLLPLSGVHLNVVRVMLSRSFLIICPGHLHLLCIITVVMFRWPVLWYSSLFVIFWGRYILHIFLRQLQSVFVNSSLFLSYNRLKLNLRCF